MKIIGINCDMAMTCESLFQSSVASCMDASCTDPFLCFFFSMVLQQAMEDLDDEDGVYIRYCTDGSLFSLRHLQAHTKTLEQPFGDLLFADDAAIVAHTETALHHTTSCFAEAAQVFGLEVSMKKTEVLHQPSPHVVHHPPRITIGHSELKSVHQFSYLGRTISSDPN